MPVVFDVPNIEDIALKELDRQATITASQIETEAKVTAPVKTGNYRNNIIQSGNEVVANAPYSAKLEYVGRKGVPYSTMRNAARIVAARRGFDFEG